MVPEDDVARWQFTATSSRSTGTLQVLAPMAVAIVVATLLGTLVVHAYAALAGWPPLADATRAWLVFGSTLIGALIVSLATVPIIRTRVTADLLRRE